MRYFALLLFFGLSWVTRSQDLNQYKWENRLIILFGAEDDELLIKQRKLFTTKNEELKERDLKIISADTSLYKKLNIEKDFRGIVLIGKDGSVKFKRAFVVPPKEIYAIIDGMPMRKAEMKTNKY